MKQPSDAPLSWLTLERYALGELDASERREVEQRLAVSAEDRACLAQIEADQSTLPELPTAQPSPAYWPASTFQPTRKRRAPGWVGSLALAALALLALARELRDGPAVAPVSGTTATKGGGIALVLVNERGEPASHFAPGERFKPLVTCPPDFAQPLHVLAFQAGQRYEPLAPRPLRCGNAVAWPGAFALDGEAPVEVCIAWGNRVVSARSRAELADNAACIRLIPK